jgi:NAD(P)-dependent dehydrogenase (short-subunit alcohol dehydrogenase family)
MADKHAVITGGGSGIGAAIAARLAKDGTRLTLVGRTRDKLEKRAKELPYAQAIVADATREEDVARAFFGAEKTFGPVTILINNAGGATSAPIGKTSLADWQEMLSVNATSAFLCARAAVPHMLAAGFGRIVNIASTGGLMGYAYVTAYCAAKHALVGLTRALAAELVKKPITVNAVCPGFTETDLLARSLENIVAKTGRSLAEARADIARINPQGRMITPDEVAATVAWLCTPEASSITGQAIAIAGGELM